MGHQLERTRLHGCYLSAFPGDQEALQRTLQERLDRAEAEAQHRQHPQGSIGEAGGTPAVKISAAGQAAPRTSVDEAAQQLSASEGAKGTGPATPVPQQHWPEPLEQKLAAKRAAEQAAAEAEPTACTEAQAAQRATEALVLELQSELQQGQLDLSAAAKNFQYSMAAPDFSLPAKAAPSQTSLASADGPAASSAGRAASLRSDAPAFHRRNSSSSQTPSLLNQPPPGPIPGKNMLTLDKFLTRLICSWDTKHAHSGGLTVGCPGLCHGEDVLASVHAAQLTDASSVCPGRKAISRLVVRRAGQAEGPAAGWLHQ